MPWTNETHVATLRAILRRSVGQGRPYSFDQVMDDLAAQAPDDQLMRNRWLRGFVGGNPPRPRSFRTLDHLLKWVVEVISRDGHEALLRDPAYETARALYEEAPERAASQPLAIAAPDLVRAFNVVLALLNLRATDFQRHNDALFVDHQKPRQERHYLCYRYHSRPGFIVKSFLAVMGPGPDGPNVATFKCFFKDQGVVRPSEGIVIPMGQATYLVGQIEKSAGLKALVVPHLENRKPSYPGLILSMDQHLSPIVGRCVLVPTDKANDKEAGVGIFPEADLEAEAKDFREQFTNTIDFTLREGLSFDGVLVSQRKMVFKVEELVADGNGRSRFTYAESKEPFNPADHKHYTFNAAVTVCQN